MYKHITQKNILSKFPRKRFSQLVSYTTSNEIGILTIKNNSKRNSLNFEILTSLCDELDKLNLNFQNKIPTPRVLLLSSEGSVFSSGHDLKELNSSSQDQKQKIFDKCSELMMKLQNSSCIIICEVQGLATAAGCQLVASCDLVVASSKAKFETPGVRIGLFCSTPSVALARAISTKRAMHMLVTGEQISAKKAEEWGLVNEIIDVDNCENEVEQREKLRHSTLKLAQHINSYSGETLSFGKRIFYSQLGHANLNEAYNIAGNAMCTNFSFTDTKEGVSAFLQKRKPVFNSKI